MGDENLRVHRVSRFEGHGEPPRDDDDPIKRVGLAISHFFFVILNRWMPDFVRDHVFKESLPLFLKKVLTELKKQFARLRESDFVTNPGFTSHFSSIWNDLLIEFSEMRKREKHYDTIKQFIAIIDAFPEKGEHALGHYLRNYAGETWLPVPYLDILKKLHRDFLVHGEKSDLNRFITHLSDLLDK